MSKAKVIRLGVENKPAIQQAAQIEECLNNFAVIIQLIDREIEDHCDAAGAGSAGIMCYLVTDLSRNFHLLDGLLQMRSTTVAG